MSTAEVVEAPPDKLSGPQKAAVMLMSIDEQSSAALLKQFLEPEIENVAREIANLGAVSAEVG